MAAVQERRRLSDPPRSLALGCRCSAMAKQQDQAQAEAPAWYKEPCMLGIGKRRAWDAWACECALMCLAAPGLDYSSHACMATNSLPQTLPVVCR